MYQTFPSQKNDLFRSAWTDKINVFPSRTRSSKTTFFPYYIKEWNLNAEVRNAMSIHFFKKMIAAERKENSLFSVYDFFCVKFLTRLRLQLCHLNEHNIRHCFGDTVSATCECNTETEDTEHSLLHWYFYSTQRF